MVLTRLLGDGAVPLCTQFAPPSLYGSRVSFWEAFSLAIVLPPSTNFLYETPGSIHIYTIVNTLFTLSYIALNTSSLNKFLTGHLSKF